MGLVRHKARVARPDMAAPRAHKAGGPFSSQALRGDLPTTVFSNKPQTTTYQLTGSGDIVLIVPTAAQGFFRPSVQNRQPSDQIHAVRRRIIGSGAESTASHS